MKNKLILLSFLLAGATCSLYAQEDARKKYVSDNWTDNFFISVGGGAQVCTNPDNFDFGFGKAITPQITFSVGKLINPVWGVRGQFTGWKSKLNTDYKMNVYDLRSNDHRKWKKNYITLNADAMLNVTNLLLGYKEKRVFEFSIFGGPTLTAAKPWSKWNETDVFYSENGQNYKVTRSEPAKSKFKWLVGGSVGMAAKFNLNKYLAIDVEARGNVAPPIFGVADGYDAEGALALTAGLTYTIGGKKFKPCGMSDELMSELNDQINKCRRNNDDLNSQLADTKDALRRAQDQPKEVVKTVTVETAGPYAIFFEINKAVINDRGLVNLQLAAKRIKANPDKKYKIAGYADKTGSDEFNRRLTEQRAQAVYDALVKQGVSPSQLEIIAMGAQDNMFGKNTLNRVVILE